MKKLLVVIFIATSLFVLFGCSKDLGFIDIIDEDKPTIDFGSSINLTEEDVLVYITDFESRYTLLNTPCLFEAYHSDELITREIVSDAYSNSCDLDTMIFYTDFSVLIDITDIIFNLYDTVISNEVKDMGSTKIIIEFNEDALRLTWYSEDQSFFNQYTLATIDDDVYYEYYKYADNNDQDYYSYALYYQNHFAKSEYLDPNGTRYYQKNLESSEIINIDIAFFNPQRSAYATTLVIGDSDYINVVDYHNSQISSVTIKQLNNNYVEFEYRDGGLLNYILLNALELSDWDLLEKDPHSNNYKMYSDETLIYEDLSVISLDAQKMPGILIELASDASSILTIGENTFDLESAILECDTFKENHKKFMEHYNVSIEEKTYEDYEDVFSYIKAYFDEYNNA